MGRNDARRTRIFVAGDDPAGTTDAAHSNLQHRGDAPSVQSLKYAYIVCAYIKSIISCFIITREHTREKNMSLRARGTPRGILLSRAADRFRFWPLCQVLFFFFLVRAECHWKRRRGFRVRFMTGGKMFLTQAHNSAAVSRFTALRVKSVYVYYSYLFANVL